MEEIINIIKELEEINKKEADNIEQMPEVINDKKVQYMQVELQELEQELNETKDVYKREDLSLAIEAKKEEIKEEMKKIRRKVMRERRETVKSLNKKLDEKKLYINKDIDKIKEQIEANKKEMYRIKNNRDVMKDTTGLIKPEYQKAYIDLTKQIMEKREENIKLQNEIKDMNKLIEDLNNKNFDKLLEENGKEQKVPVEENTAKIKKEEELAWQQKEREEDEEEARIETQAAQEIEEYENSIGESDGIEDNEEQQDYNTEGSIKKVTIYPGKVTIKTSIKEYDMSRDNLFDDTRYSNLSEETLQKLETIHLENVDENVIVSLLDNEEQLNAYLDLCTLFNGEPVVTEKDLEGKDILPEIEYNFKNLRKDLALSDEEKLAMYRKAKDTKEMMREMLKSKVKIKMSIFDKMYFGVKGLMSTLKSKIALPAPKEDIKNKENATEVTIVEPNQIKEKEETPRDRLLKDLREGVDDEISDDEFIKVARGFFKQNGKDNIDEEEHGDLDK